MGLFTSNQSSYSNELTSLEQWQELWNSDQRFAVFKHSTRCPISSMALNQFKAEGGFDKDTPVYFLDLIAYRTVSNAIADDTGVRHESPQFLLIHSQGVIDHASHGDIHAGMV